MRNCPSSRLQASVAFALNLSSISRFIMEPVTPTTGKSPASRRIASAADAVITITPDIRFRHSSRSKNFSAASSSFSLMRAIFHIILSHTSESKSPRSKIKTSGSSSRGGLCVFSNTWANVVQAVQTLKFPCFLSRIGQTEARSITTSTLKPQRFRNALRVPRVVVFPALGVPANSITTGLRPFVLNSKARASARFWISDFTGD